MIIKSPFKEYEKVLVFYKNISKETELQKIFNKEILTYTDLLEIYLSNPGTRKKDLDQDIQRCLDAKNNCFGYKFEIKDVDKKRVGNFWKDLFRFKRETRTTGWEFKGLVLIIDGEIIYKERPGGKPKIVEQKIERKPLGPLQEAGDVATGAIKSLL